MAPLPAAGPAREPRRMSFWRRRLNRYWRRRRERRDAPVATLVADALAGPELG